MGYTFKSGFAEELQLYLEMKQASGYSKESFLQDLKKFDQFCFDRGIDSVRFSRDDADAWRKQIGTEASTTRYVRVNCAKNFLNHLIIKGYMLYPIQDIKYRPTDFKPHIYSESEIQRYFKAVDEYESRASRIDAIQFPILFRILLCCGTRIGETLRIRKNDVDLDAGIIRLLETKNHTQRYVVMSDSLKELMQEYAYKMFYLLNDDSLIFFTDKSTPRYVQRIHDVHRILLQRANIPYAGEGKGPRIHDWRHTFAVRSFKQMIDSGMDMYVALPILSTYLGHKTILATERYVRLTVELYPYISKKWEEKFNTVFGKVAKSYETT